MSKNYKGSDIFLETLKLQGVKYMFGNPGTTELPIMDSLSDYPDLSYILTLHEGVAVAAAHAYALATGKVGVVNLHVAPGLGNGLGLMYTSMDGHSPLVITAGQQDTRMRVREPLLGGDLVEMAKPLVKWSVQVERADEMAHVLNRAFKVALEPPAGPVFVSLPMNVMDETTQVAPMPPARVFGRTRPSVEGLSQVVKMILGAKKPTIICGDGIAYVRAQDALVKLSENIGAGVHTEVLTHHVNFPFTHANFRDRMPGDNALTRKILGDTDTVILIGGDFFEEVWLTEGSPFPEGATVIQIDNVMGNLGKNFSLDAGLAGDIGLTLAELNEAINKEAPPAFVTAAAMRNKELETLKQKERERQQARAEKNWEVVPIHTARLMAEIRDNLPPQTVVVSEAITATADLNRTLNLQNQGDLYATRSGGLGQGLPGGIGAKLAHPERPVLVLVGDGSSLYAIQTLWSASHHKIPVVFLILHNQAYRILKLNMNRYRANVGRSGEKPYPHMDLNDPHMDYVSLAQGFGIQAKKVESPNNLAEAIGAAFQHTQSQKEPYLLEVMTDGSL